MYTAGKLIAVILFCIFVILLPKTILWYITSAIGLVVLLAIFVQLGSFFIDPWIDKKCEPWTEWDE